MQRFIDPLTLARIKDLPLVAKRVANGFLFGLSASVQRGSGAEFSQYRSYESGDALSRIDWKLFARSDRYFVRETERESDIQVWFLVDNSKSMLLRSQHSSPAALKSDDKTPHIAPHIAPWHKLDYARHMAASMAYLAQSQGDSVGYMGLADNKTHFLHAGRGVKHWRKLLAVMTQTHLGRGFPKADALTVYTNRLRKPALVFVISDFYQRDNEIMELIRQLNSSKSEIVAMQLYCQDELNFNYRGTLRVRDLESDEELLLRADDVKNTYLTRVEEHRHRLAESLAHYRANLHTVDIDQPLDHVLYEYLKQRQRVRG